MPTAAEPLAHSIRAALPRAVEIRHDLHRHPELGHKEMRTAGLVQRELAALGIDHLGGLAKGTGVLGYLPATTDPRTATTIALRADMDALPITEATGKPYTSCTPGLMHACGHDGHTSILLTAARVLAQSPHRPNNIAFVFQPAEEGGGGGELMCRDRVLDGSRLGTPVDMIYGLHGWPELAVGHVATRTGPLLAATNEFDITITGRGGHAAHPERANDPVVVAAHMITALQTIASRRVEAFDNIVVTIGSVQAGAANNVIPDTALLRGTLRTVSETTRALGIAQITRICAGIAETFGATAEIDWWGGYPITINHPETTARFRRIADERLGAGRLVERPSPTMGGEDFAYYGQLVPATFFFLGLRPESADTYPALHHPKFDFNDDALPTGVDLMCSLALDPT